MKEQYGKLIRIHRRGLELIDSINETIETYQNQGYNLTLRQVYYQLVSKALIPNTENSYNAIGNLVNNGRLAGLIDWDAIEDRNRFLRKQNHWSSPNSILKSAAYSYRRDLWEGQINYVEVWVEKDALIGIVEKASKELDTPCFSCRGYTSITSLKDAAERIKTKTNQGRHCKIIYLGDHDPSGLDMTRDITDRLEIFEARVKIDRLALTMEQIQQYNPPPNPAKQTDSRFREYERKYGKTSWELDALEPVTLDRLITEAIKNHLNLKRFSTVLKQQEKERKGILTLAEKGLSV